jgi:hypothetical protein
VVVPAFGPILLIGNAVGLVSLDPPDEERKEKIRRQNADRRVFNGRISGCGARSKAERARLSAFHRGTCGGDRTPPLNSSYALPGTVLGRNGRYPLPAVIQYSELLADRSSCRPGVLPRVARERK